MEEKTGAAPFAEYKAGPGGGSPMPFLDGDAVKAGRKAFEAIGSIVG